MDWSSVTLGDLAGGGGVVVLGWLARAISSAARAYAAKARAEAEYLVAVTDAAVMARDATPRAVGLVEAIARKLGVDVGKLPPLDGSRREPPSVSEGVPVRRRSLREMVTARWRTAS